MKLKSLLFGSAAGLMVVSGAQAADLPAAEPVEYVRVCDAFGTGFFYIPGTDTCLKINGYARYEMHYVSDFDSESSSDAKDFNNFSTRARGEVRFDARTMTDLGLLRSFVALRGTVGPTDTGSYSDGFNVDKAWLSLANDTGTLTAGHHGSFYDFYGGHAMNTRIGGDDPTTSTNLLAYTFAIGNGVSASISVEDKWFRRGGTGGGIRTVSTTTTTMITTTTASSAMNVFTVTSTITAQVTAFDTTVTDARIFSREGQEWPDFVANIRIDQGWGSAQIMGAVGRVGSVGGGGLYTSQGTPAVAPADDKVGWSVGGGLSLGVPGTGIGFDMQADWAEGLVRYATTGNFAPLLDAAYGSGASFDLTRAWAIKAGITADFSSTVSFSLDGAYADVDHKGSLDDEDYKTWIVAGTIHWRPVSGLTVSGEIAYEDVDADSNAHILDDDNLWGAMMRINRVF